MSLRAVYTQNATTPQL